MRRIEPSGYHYPNKLARIYIQAIEEVMGKNGLNAILNLAGLAHLIDNYPPDNFDKEFDFADFSALNWALVIWVRDSVRLLLVGVRVMDWNPPNRPRAVETWPMAASTTSSALASCPAVAPMTALAPPVRRLVRYP